MDGRAIPATDHSLDAPPPSDLAACEVTAFPRRRTCHRVERGPLHQVCAPLSVGSARRRRGCAARATRTHCLQGRAIRTNACAGGWGPQQDACAGGAVTPPSHMPSPCSHGGASLCREALTFASDAQVLAQPFPISLAGRRQHNDGHADGLAAGQLHGLERMLSITCCDSIVGISRTFDR